LLLQPLLQYAIFPAQFAFLYSYYPTGSMGDLPAELEKIWKANHFETSEKVFEEAAAGKTFESGPSFFEKAKVESS
jgi:zeaxanthin epoxidase